MSQDDRALWCYDAYYDKWDCDCGEAFQFTVDGPKENNYRYCPACGGKIVIKEEEEEKV